ncbi:hypothetical protein D3C87_666580 [compost metagenome]
MVKTVKQFTKSNVMAFAKDLEAAMQEVAAKYGVELSTGNVKFQESEFTTPLTVKLLGENGETQLTKSLLQLMDIMGIQQNGTRGRRIVGYNGRKKQAWIFTVEGREGKFVCTDAEAKIHFKKA